MSEYHGVQGCLYRSLNATLTPDADTRGRCVCTRAARVQTSKAGDSFDVFLAGQPCGGREGNGSFRSLAFQALITMTGLGQAFATLVAREKYSFGASCSLRDNWLRDDECFGFQGDAS